MSVEFMLERFAQHAATDALVWRDASVTYGELGRAVRAFGERLESEKIPRGAVVGLEADFSPAAVAMLLALIEHAAVVVPLTESVAAQKPKFCEVAQVEFRIVLDSQDQVEVHREQRVASHPVLVELKRQGSPGLVLFSSGSTGESKAAVHDFTGLLEKFRKPRHARRMMGFLLFDHIGGVNTLLYVLSSLGCVVTVQDRSPDAVCAAIERHAVQTLPTSPTFLNLLLLSGAFERHDLKSLELITYGTEVMPETTLQRLRKVLPNVELLQTYGLSEVGILRSKSKSSDSLWVKVGGEGFETRVVDGMLEIRARSAMLGYLNAPSPFTEDGWFRTGDAVDVDGEFIRILGRKSEIINVGGEKVFPAEVEGVLQAMDGVEDVAVNGAQNPITGQMVVARVKLATDETAREFKKRMHAHCRDRMPRFKIPQKVVFLDRSLHGGRFKKMR